MVLTASETEGKVVPLKLVYDPSNSLLTASRHLFYCVSLLSGFVVRESMAFRLMFVRIVLVWLLFGHHLGMNCSLG